MPPLQRLRQPLATALLTPPRRLLVLVVLVGVGGGAIGAAYIGALHLLQRALWPTHWSPLTHLCILGGVGLAVGLLTRLLGNPGSVELLVDNIHVLGGNDEVRALRSLIPISLLCVAAGGAMGPEAPLVQTSGSFGSWVAGRAGVTRQELRILTITGMAAAFTVLFGAPIGSAIFSLEILHRRGLEYYEALLPSLLGSLAGYAVYVALTGVGLEPVWRFPARAAIDGGDLGWALACGVVGAGVAIAFTYLSAAARWLFGRVPADARPFLGGLVLGGLALWSPYALTFGEAQIDPLLHRNPLWTVFAIAAVAKLLGTTVTLSSGWRGGFIIPMFFIGVALGRLGHVLIPGTHEVVLMTCLMVAINVGVTKTPIGSTLVVTEMAGLHLLPTTLIAAVVGLLLTSEVGVIHTQRQREQSQEGLADQRHPGADVEPSTP
jgi:H+/Cl- antiporter ClcA